jgi:hypothetical protein
MTLKWERRDILIWGKTRPEVSQTYREIVCTGGVFKDSKRLVRIYPVPLRYLEAESIFKKYQWIRADVAKATSDPRPESYKIRYENIEVLQTVPTVRGNWDTRAEFIMNPYNLAESVEDLQDQQSSTGRSLGLVAPKEVVDIRSERLPPKEREEFWARYEKAVAQIELPLDETTGKEIRPLSPPDFRYKIEFRCFDKRCERPHTFSVLDWDVDALYARQKQTRSPQQAAKEVVDKLKEVCDDDKDTRFFLGNIASHPQNFTIVGLWYPKRKLSRESKSTPQMGLF